MVLTRTRPPPPAEVFLPTHSISMLHGTYDPWLVAASLLISVVASYTALDMAGRVAAAEGAAARWWLAGGSFAMGVGIWSMHFVGMLALRLPMRVSYEPVLTLLSLLMAMASSAYALCRVCRETLTAARLILGAVVMGAGIAAMHYTGMAAMHMSPGVHYVPWLFALSILIAVVAAGGALWITFHLRRRGAGVWRLRAASAVAMGIAVAGMHYTGMAAARFPAGSTSTMADSGISAGWLAVLIVILALTVLSIALIVSVLDSRMAARTALLSDSLANANRELQFLALHDSLTKLPNRALLEDRLQQEIQMALRARSRFSVLFLDLDGFKQVNDAFGHHIGDLLLVEASQRIRAAIRGSDTLARLGGDEFVLITSAGEPADAASLADKLVLALRDPIVIAGHQLRITASVGIAIYGGGEILPTELLKNADAAMYHAKALGRDGYCFFETSMNEDAQNQLQLLQDLRLAQDRGELVLYYQPKIDADSGDVIGAEALLRWKHPVRGLISPDQFIPLAEKTGMIFQIGVWVLDEACRQMSLWQAAGFTNWSVSVNLSAVQFNHPGLVAMVREALRRNALEPRYLTLEITESTAMRDADASMLILQQLSDMGIRISIDDFGTGYSSLLYLKRLPASELKIDRGFVRDLAQDTEDAAIISAIIALGRTLNLKIVAEGVETAAQQDFLTRLGCNSLQGYLLGRPAPAEQFMAAVTAGQNSLA